MSIILTNTPDRTVPTFLIKRSLKIEFMFAISPNLYIYLYQGYNETLVMPNYDSSRTHNSQIS